MGNVSGPLLAIRYFSIRYNLLRPDVRLKIERTWVADHHRARVGERAGADLAEGPAHFVDHDVDDVPRPVSAERRHAPQEGLAGEGRFGAERDRPHDVEAAADAAVHHDGCAL